MGAPDTPKQIVRVTIFNQTYAIAAPGDPLATQEIARSVDELMSSIARRAGNLDTSRTAVLACLHLADRLRQTEEELNALRGAVAQKTRAFSLVLDRAFSTSLEDQRE